MTTSAIPPATSIDLEPAPISALMQYTPVIASNIVKITSSSFHLTSWLIRSSFSYPKRIILSPLSVLLSVFLYLLAPVIVFVQVLLDVLVLMPYNSVIYLVDAIYPLYVFCGVACITGVIVGVLARQLVFWLTELGKLDEVPEQPIELVAENVKWEEV
ncbi:uncharacterized protein C8R40DRAFT_851683 [Lentinula edodes]|uniref:uncharacterized protein n=1 Tax=Lentinula edodes TaxID=5353 RepID=UPI001E8D9E63|nr:uncharacterized protein C8R40DRAFT_851683 [Lentinula edodes]KAH7868226.1 hypothetical protein C8R40DRAFT_851683 [Lentinula edodes]